MCFNKQPDPPINKPAYAPEDSYTAFKYGIEKPDGTKEDIPAPKAPSPEAQPVKPAAPTVKRKPIVRM